MPREFPSPAVKAMRRPVLVLAALGLSALLGYRVSVGAATANGAAAPLAQRTDHYQAAASNARHAVAVRYGGLTVMGLQGELVARLDLPAAPALIDIAACHDGSFAALDFDRKVWLGDGAAKSWKSTALPGKSRPLALTCDRKNQIWVVGSDTTISVSRDKGAGWTSQNLKKDAMLNSIQFVDDEFGFITGEFGMVLETQDGGQSWKPTAKIADDFYPYAALFVSRTEGYVSGLAGAILKTNDGAKTWLKTDNASGLPQFGLARQGGTIYSVGIGGSMQRLEGNRWVSIDYSPRAPAWLRAVSPGAEGVLIIGGGGALQRVAVGTATNTSAKP